MILLDGKTTAANLRQSMRGVCEKQTEATGRAPGLAVILVGDDPASQVYVRNKIKACEDVGIRSISHTPEASISQAELLSLIDDLNRDPAVDGILLQLPLPDHLDEQYCLDQISPAKDVDGFSPQSMGRLTLGLEGFLPCTPAGVIALLARYELSPAGKRAVVLGRSNIVGKPLSLLLARNHEIGNATVTLCHSRTQNLGDVTREADFLFVAIGRARFVTRDMVKPGAVVVDVGMNRVDGKLCGDVDFEGVKDAASAITPVPGGVGPMTIAMLMANTLRSHALAHGLTPLDCADPSALAKAT